MKRSRTTIGVATTLASVVILAGCSSPAAEAPAGGSSAAPSPATSSAPFPTSPSSSAPAASGTSASAAPSDVLRVKVISQLKEPVDPSGCGSSDATAGGPAGTDVTVTDEDGKVLGTQPLRVPEQGEPYGPQGHTFEGWDDLEEVDGVKVTYACFYLADFPGIPASETYVISIDGATDVQTTPAQLAESEGWILQIIG